MRLIARFLGFLFATGALVFVIGAGRGCACSSGITSRICRTTPS